MTDLLAWLNPARWLMLAAVSASLVLGYTLWAGHQQGIGEARANSRWKIATDQLKREATATLATETAKVHAAEQALQDFKNQQERKDASNKNTVAVLSGRLRQLVRADGGRLRDPNAAGCGGGSGGPTGQVATAAGDRADDRAETGGFLSEQLSGLLLDRLEEADAINIAYIACRADTAAVRADAPLGDSR